MERLILGIDPGKHRLGWAVVMPMDSGYYALDYGRSGDYTGGWPNTLVNGIHEIRREAGHYKLARVVVEIPRVYYHVTPRPNDIIDLAFAAGAITGAVAVQWYGVPIHVVTPLEWKGNVPKKVIQERLRQRVVFSKDEPKDHNIMDAVGIAVFGHERFER